MGNVKWRFPHNNYAGETGIDSSDVETFKYNPIGSLAREIVQNSIDANKEAKAKGPTIVHFKSFELKQNEIPGQQTLYKEVLNCYEYKKHVIKEEKPLRIIKNNLEMEKIICLRISDFNTTGLIGVEDNDIEKPFYILTRGSGISNKEGTAGGSKGIGKYSSFVVSNTNTVFYSTLTEDNYEGYIGISKLRSAPADSPDSTLLTQGIGYYAQGDRYLPFNRQLNLDNSFNRKSPGTDIYIIGFTKSKDWEKEVIAEILQSFMISVLKDNLKVEVDNLILDSQTVHRIIKDQSIISIKGVRNQREIVSQYELLTEDDIHKKTYDIFGIGKITLYVKKYNRNSEVKASKRCVYIRYPYMRIKYDTGAVNLPYSALCIIDDDELNERLRDLENPQHTNWEINRLKDYPKEMEEMKKVKKEIENNVRQGIMEYIRSNTNESVDFEGAGDYFPSENFKEDEGGAGSTDDFYVTKPKQSKPKLQDTSGEGNPEEAEIENSGSEEERQANGVGSKVSGKGVKTKVVTRRIIPGIKFKNLVTNVKEGEFTVIFTSKVDEDNCSILINQFGDGNDKYSVNIIEATHEGKSLTVDKGEIVNFKLKAEKKYKIEYKCNVNELFLSEVILYAYR